MKRLLFALALMAAVISAAAQTTVPSPASIEAIEDRWVRHYWERVVEFQEQNATLAPDEDHIVLLGSSSMMHWRENDRVARFLPEGYHFLNRGIGADRIGLVGERGILHRLESSVFDCHPSTVFIMNGRNDLGATMRTGEPAVADVAATYREVIERIQESVPGVKVVIITCPPVNLRYEAMAPLLIEYNELLKQIGEDLGCDVIDFHSMMVGEDGLLPLDLTHDGLHFNDEGFRRLGEAIAQELEQESTP